MRRRKSLLRFNKQERRGIFFLICLIFLFQLLNYLLQNNGYGTRMLLFEVDLESQAKIDSLLALKEQKRTIKFKSFNPNFITDYKGYILGMSTEEIDRLHQFRRTGKYVHSAKDFQRITGISDSLLLEISSYFKFPEWVNMPKNVMRRANFVQEPNVSKREVEYADLNEVTAQNLMEIHGIGEILSRRIVKFRDALGGFLVGEQLYDVYGLDIGTANNILVKYKIINKPAVNQINLNRASVEEIAALVYISWPVAKDIVAYRNQHGHFQSWDELKKIQDFPSEKIDRIKLYLTLKKLLE